MLVSVFSTIFFLAVSFAECSSPFSLRIDELGNTVTFHVQTEVQSAMCPLMIQSLEMKHPRIDQPGCIFLEVDTDPNGICLMDIGPHQGVFSFSSGKSLPDLKRGEYELFLNGRFYGKLIIGPDGIRLL